MRALVGVAVAAVLIVGVDVAALRIVEERIEERARREVPGARSVEADVDSVPFLPRLLATGSVSGVRVRLEEVPTRVVTFTALEVRLRDVSLDRDAVVSGDVAVRSIDRGTVVAELDAASLSRALRRPVTISAGEISVGVGRARVGVRPDVRRDGSLVLRAGRLSLAVPLGRIRLLDCSLVRVAVVDQRVRLSCNLDHVPAGLARDRSGAGWAQRVAVL